MRSRCSISPHLGALTVGVLLGVGAALGVGFLTSQPAADAHLSAWGHTWPYAFTSSNCGWNTDVDPVSIVFYDDATTAKVHGHSDHHGYGHDEGTTATQYFDDHGCSSMDGQDASSSFYNSRYHHRYNKKSDSTWGTYQIATPHYEDITKCGAIWKHAVRENGSSSMPEGGFVNAKWQVNIRFSNWNNGGSHYWAGYQVWDNERAFGQCDGGVAWGDGIIDFIRID